MTEYSFARARKLPSPGFLASALLSLLACKNEPELVLNDTEGRSFSARCDESAKSCQLRPRFEKADAADQRAFLRNEGRILSVCEGAHSHAADCRALVCQSDAQCPPIHGGATGTCVAGLCIDASRPVGASDAVLLCLAGTGLGHGAPHQVERYAMALNCGTPCRVPSPCRQP